MPGSLGVGRASNFLLFLPPFLWIFYYARLSPHSTHSSEGQTWLTSKDTCWKCFRLGKAHFKRQPKPSLVTLDCSRNNPSSGRGHGSSPVLPFVRPERRPKRTCISNYLSSARADRVRRLSPRQLQQRNCCQTVWLFSNHAGSDVVAIAEPGRRPVRGRAREIEAQKVRVRGAERRVRRGACAVQSRGAGSALAILCFRLARGPTGGCWNGCWLPAATRAWVSEESSVPPGRCPLPHPLC